MRVVFMGSSAASAECLRALLREECLEEIRQTLPMTPEIQYILDFVTNSKRGIIK